MRPLKVGVVGAGGITRQHAPSWIALGADVSVYALAGAEQLAREFALTVVGSMEELLSRVDLVDICTTTTTHAELALLSVEAGTPVICEKPLGANFREALDLARAARAAGVSVLPGHVVRFFPQYERVHTAVGEGRIGCPAVLRFIRGGSGPTSDWFYDDHLSGGVIMDLMIHDLDQARWLAGEVTSVYAVQSPHNDGDRIPRAVTTHVTMTHRTGALSHALGFWGPAGLSFGPSLDVAGARGRLWTTAETTATVFEDLPGGAPQISVSALDESPFLRELREFSQVLRSGSTARVNLEDGVAAVALCEAARESVRTGSPVEFEPYATQIAEVCAA